jgi:hypothetical protein
VVDGYGQLDDPEPGAEMPAGHRHRRDHLLAKLVGQLRQLRLAQRADVGGRSDGVEQRGHGPVTWAITHARPHSPSEDGKSNIQISIGGMDRSLHGRPSEE